MAVSKPVRWLEIGPGNERIPGFETVNIVKTEHTDYIADLNAGLPFADESFDKVYAAHILEHIVWYRLNHAFKEIHRIIKRGGHADIWVPDGLKIARAFVDAEENNSRDFEQDKWYRLNPEHDPAVWFNGRIFSYGDGTGDKAHFNVHAAAFSPRFLRQELLRAGFERVEPLNRSDVLGWNHGWINLGMRAYKKDK